MDEQTIAKRRSELNRKKFPSEMWFEKILTHHGMCGYRRNHALLGRFFGDFVWRKKKLVVEIDGSSHNGKEDYDQRRDAFLESFGYKVKRVRFSDVDASLKVIGWLKENGIKVRDLSFKKTHTFFKYENLNKPKIKSPKQSEASKILESLKRKEAALIKARRDKISLEKKAKSEIENKKRMLRAKENAEKPHEVGWGYYQRNKYGRF
jgi:very-short-patch-repair endonuclease